MIWFSAALKRMTEMLKKLKVNLILFFIVLCVFLYGETEKAGSVEISGKTASRVLDITKVENSLNQLKRTLDVMPAGDSRQNVRLKRDPFVPLFSPESAKKETADGTAGEIKKAPEFNVYGIIFDSKSSIAIIGDEVKKEGEYIGEYQVYKIMKDNVLIKRGDSIFPIDIKK